VKYNNHFKNSEFNEFLSSHTL